MLVSGLGARDTRRVADDGEKWAPGLMSSDFLWQLVATEDKHIVNIIIIITPTIRITKFVMKEKKKHEAIHTAIVKCSITISPCPEISDEVISLLLARAPVYSRHVPASRVGGDQSISRNISVPCSVICSEFDKLLEFREMAVAMRPKISI